MCTGHQYKEHLWKINSQRRVVDGINGQYIFRFSWKLLFQLEQKCKHQKGNLSQPLKLSQMLMGVKGKLMKKCEFRIQISSSLFSQFKSLIAVENPAKWKRIQIFYEGNDITQILASFLRCATGQLFYGSGRHASAIIPTSTKMQSAPLRAWKWSLIKFALFSHQSTLYRYRVAAEAAFSIGFHRPSSFFLWSFSCGSLLLVIDPAQLLVLRENIMHYSFSSPWPTLWLLVIGELLKELEVIANIETNLLPL